MTEGCAHCARREEERQEPLDLAPINRALKDTVSGFAYRRHVRGEKNPRIYKDDMRLLISEIEQLRAESVAKLAAISRQVEALEAAWRAEANAAETRKNECMDSNHMPGVDINRAKMLSLRACADALQTLKEQLT